MTNRKIFTISVFILISISIYSQDKRPLTGKSLAQLDFFYCGESRGDKDMHYLYIIKDGKLAWEYTCPDPGSTSDGMLLTDGNIIYTHKDGISEINQNKEVLWTIRVPEGTEVHSDQPIGNEHVIYFLCGKPAKIVVANIKTKQTVHEMVVETNPEVYAHTQNRVARLTPWGTYVVPHLNYGKVREYNSKGDIVWEVNAPRPWCVQVLPNGNVLVANEMTDTNDSVKSYQNDKELMVKNWNLVQEFNRKGEVVWEVKYEDHPEYHGTTIQGAYRTEDGNTIISNTIENRPQ